MSKKRLYLPALLLSLALGQASISNVYAAADEPLRSCICGMHIEKIVQTFHLTPDQKNKIEELIEKNKANIKTDVEQMQGLRVQMRDLITSDNFDEDKVNALIDKKKELIGTIAKAKVMVKRQIYTLLNAQQKAEYKALVQKHEEQLH